MSELDLIPGRIAPPFLAPVDPRTTSTTTATTANVVYWMRLPTIQAPMLLTKMYYFWSSGAANGAGALLTADRTVLVDADALAATYARVAQTPEAAASGANTWQVLTFSAGYVYQPGTAVWVSLGFDAAATILRALGNSAATLIGGLAVAKGSAYSAGIPTSLAGSLSGSSIVPVVVLA